VQVENTYSSLIVTEFDKGLVQASPVETPCRALCESDGSESVQYLAKSLVGRMKPLAVYTRFGKEANKRLSSDHGNRLWKIAVLGRVISPRLKAIKGLTYNYVGQCWTHGPTMFIYKQN